HRLVLLLLLRVAGDDGGRVDGRVSGSDRGESGRVRVGRALGGTRRLAGRLALALLVVLLGALLVAGLLALRIALSGRRGGHRQRDRHSDDDGRGGAGVHGVLLGALGLAGG
ncbi:hypothetical protein PFISCL1PPCAC_5447, partial [Pristionchus fissidentatus]